MDTPIAVADTPNPASPARRVTVLASLLVTLLVVALWGPVSRGLHEESVERWCVQSTGHASVAGLAFDVAQQVDQCVEQALSDPAFTATLRAGL